MDLSNFGVDVKKDENKPNEIIDENLNIDFDKIKKDFSQEEVERFMPWFLKYRLQNFEDLIVTKEIKKILEFLEKRPKNKGILLYGQAGSGKTTTITLIGNHFNYEIFELNASDARNKNSIEESVGEVINQRSLFQQEKLILIDEVDGVSGSKDRGGVASLIKILATSKYPICFTANDIEKDNIKALKKKCVLVDFENHSFELLFELGKKILTQEKIKFEEKELTNFVEERNTTDIRGFINDLQAEVINNEFKPTGELELRNYKQKIEQLMDKIFYSYPEDSLKSSFNTDINLDDLFLYLEENLPNVYDKVSLFKGFNEIAKADVFRGRIYKWQYWRYLVYINFYLTFGVSDSKNKVEKIKYKRNERILKKWIYSNKYSALNTRTKIQKSKDEPLTFIEKLSKIIGRSAKKIRREDIFYFAKTYQNSVEFRENMNKKFEIDEKLENTLMEI